MTDKKFTNGLLLLVIGLMTSSISSVIEDFKILGSSSNFAMGFFDGLSVVIFAIAIFFLARSRGSA
jgi:hypothetical protein